MKIEISNMGKFNAGFTLKMALLAALALMLLIPLEMIKSVIQEREANADTVKEEISGQWGGTQVITGPVLNIPMTQNVKLEKGVEVRTSILHVMPESLFVNGNIESEIRYYGIYNTVIYSAGITASGHFNLDGVKYPDGFKPNLKDAYFTIGITDNRGLIGAVDFKVSEESLTAIPGVQDRDLYSSGVTFPVGQNPETENQAFNLKFKINGSGGLYFVPVGKETSVNIQSDWSSPSFKGLFLPGVREIDDSGFTASWIVTDLNRNFPQYWSGKSYDPESESFGVEIIWPVDHYLKSHRSVRYGILFIVLTFVALLFIELLSGAKVHLFHYLLVALGLVLFFSILTSASEHIGFGPAYLISALAITGMLTFFTAGLLKKRKYTIIFISMLAILYLFIYILLNLVDYAFLAGNIGLFISLGAIMYVSLKVNVDQPVERADK